KYKQEIINILNEEFKKDKRKTEVLGMTRLGLVEVARRRERESIDKYYLKECNACEGRALIKSTNSILDNIEKEVIRINSHTSYKDITIELNNDTLNIIKMNFMDIIQKISQKYEVKIQLIENNKINYEKINIIYNS
ncbi:MAG: ribonuclease E/G, partial [Romboutsia sp.]|nr:ribonuclease E/G [Romboutsia sp.]